MLSTIIGTLPSRIAKDELDIAHERFTYILVNILVNNYPAKSINLSIDPQKSLKNIPEVSKADVANLDYLITRQKSLIEKSLLISKNLKTYCLQPLGADIYLKVSNPMFPGQIHGLTSCKKYWICPRCSEAISIGHTKDIQIAVDAANKLGKRYQSLP